MASSEVSAENSKTTHAAEFCTQLCVALFVGFLKSISQTIKAQSPTSKLYNTRASHLTHFLSHKFLTFLHLFASQNPILNRILSFYFDFSRHLTQHPVRGIIQPLGGTLDLSPVLAFLVLNAFTSIAAALSAELPGSGASQGRHRSPYTLFTTLTSSQKKWIRRFTETSHRTPLVPIRPLCNSLLVYICFSFCDFQTF